MPLTLGLSILVSGAFGTVQISEPPVSAAVVAKAPAAVYKPAARATMANAVMSSEADPTVLKAVRDYFADIPIMIAIAGCESGYHQYDLNGNILRSVTNDLGVMQINAYTHSSAAAALGYDLNDMYGNMAYARRLYNESGTAPWLSSSGCWNRKNTVAQADTGDIADRSK